MITVRDGGAMAGYSGTDHLIDDRDIQDLVGRQFRSVGEALRQAERRCWMGAHGSVPRRRHGYVWLSVVFADGFEKKVRSV